MSPRTDCERRRLVAESGRRGPACGSAPGGSPLQHGLELLPDPLRPGAGVVGEHQGHQRLPRVVAKSWRRRRVRRAGQASPSLHGHRQQPRRKRPARGAREESQLERRASGGKRAADRAGPSAVSTGNNEQLHCAGEGKGYCQMQFKFTGNPERCYGSATEELGKHVDSGKWAVIKGFQIVTYCQPEVEVLDSQPKDCYSVCGNCYD
jgi:hypothetical protein